MAYLQEDNIDENGWDIDVNIATPSTTKKGIGLKISQSDTATMHFVMDYNKTLDECITIINTTLSLLGVSEFSSENFFQYEVGE